jgi:flagellar export protein FliJ
MARNGGSTFRLARLLELREQQVAVCRDRVEQCRAELQRWEAHRSEIVRRRDASALAPGGGVDGGGADLRLREQGRRWFQQELARVAAETEQWRHALETAQADLWQAEQRRRRIDHLRERFENEQQREAKRLQRRRMNRWGQNGTGGRP